MIQSILSLSEFKADASRLLDKVRDEPGTLVLTRNGRARAVVEDYEQYQAKERALLLLKLMAQGERDVADDRQQPTQAVAVAVGALEGQELGDAIDGEGIRLGVGPDQAAGIPGAAAERLVEGRALESRVPPKEPFQQRDGKPRNLRFVPLTRHPLDRDCVRLPSLKPSRSLPSGPPGPFTGQVSASWIALATSGSSR